MKLVITTQVRENYGSADAPYWKCKGGNTFVVPNLTPAQAIRVREDGIPTLTSLLNTYNPMFEEFIVGWSLADNDEVVCEDWETPFELYFEKGKWVARRTTENGEYGYMRAEVASKFEQYVLLPNGEQAQYQVTYVMRNGDIVPSAQIESYLKKAA